MERFVDNKIDKAEGIVKKQQKKAMRWYQNESGENYFRVKESYIFVTSFFAGVAIGMAVS